MISFPRKKSSLNKKEEKENTDLKESVSYWLKYLELYYKKNPGKHKDKERYARTLQTKRIELLNNEDKKEFM